MNVHGHLMQLHHLLVGAVCALAVAGCAGTQQFPPMDRDGVYYEAFPESQGAWETTGSARSNGRDCQWRLHAYAPATDSIADVAASMITRGAVAPGQTARVTLASGEFFVSYGCQPWNKVA
jgi:hypothetical protein